MTFKNNDEDNLPQKIWEGIEMSKNGGTPLPDARGSILFFGFVIFLMWLTS